MWKLIFTLLFLQQAEGTDVKVETKTFDGFTVESSCTAAGEALVKTHEKIAIETETDYDESKHDGKEQPDEEKFELLRPFYTCIEIK